MSNVKADKFLVARLDEIHVDLGWNSRSGFEVTEDVSGVETEGATVAANSQHTSDASTGLNGKISSIAARGQDTPIVVRPNPFGGKKPYSLVAGFQRYEAISRLNHAKTPIPGLEPNSIKVQVRELTEAEAQELNVAENTPRDELSPPDLLFGVARLRNTWKGAGLDLTQKELGNKLGISQPYVGTLLIIHDNVDGKILADWRKATRKLTVKEMTEIAKLDKKDQRAKYNELERPTGETDPDEDKAAKARKKFKNAEKAAFAIGETFGNIARDEGFVESDVEGEDFWGEYLPYLIKVSDKFTDNQKGKLVVAAMKGYSLGMEEAVEEEVSEDEETSKGKGKGAKGKNGARQVAAN